MDSVGPAVDMEVQVRTIHPSIPRPMSTQPSTLLIWEMMTGRAGGACVERTGGFWTGRDGGVEEEGEVKYKMCVAGGRVETHGMRKKAVERKSTMDVPYAKRSAEAIATGARSQFHQDLYLCLTSCMLSIDTLWRPQTKQVDEI